MRYWGDYPGGAYIQQTGEAQIQQRHISMSDNTYGISDPNKGGAGWMLYVTEDITDPLSNNHDDAGSEGEYINNNLHTIIKANSIIPCQSAQRAALDETGLSGAWWGDEYDARRSGEFFGFDYAYFADPEYFAITPGTGEEVEKRLTTLFTIPDLDISDEEECYTYAYGKIRCIFPGGDLSNTNGINTDFKLEVAPAAIEEEGAVIFEELNGHPIISIAGGSGSIIQDGGESFWSTSGNDIGIEDNAFVTETELADLSDNWGMANDSHGITAAFRMLSNNEGEYLSMATHIYSLGVLQYITFTNALSSEFYVDSHGRADIADDNGVFKYTGNLGAGKDMIENPADILYHFVEKELGYENVINEDTLIKARNVHSNFNLAFSVKDKINSKKLIEDISKNTFLFPKFTIDGNFGFDSIKDTYNDSDINVIFKEKDIIDISFSRTPIQDINTIVNVKYKKDYAKDEYLRQTGYCDAYDFFGNGDGYLEGMVFDQDYEATNGRPDGYSYSYYNLEREDKVLEFESDYIRDKETAIKLRNFLMLHNANQHNVVNFTTTLRHINLETGDIIKFDTLIDDLKCYGEDYTKLNDRNGQKIYPYFKITDISKTRKNIKIKAIQLHKLVSTFVPQVGSLTRMTNHFEYNWNWEDVNILNKIIEGHLTYVTTKQLALGNLDGSAGGIIDQTDLSLLISMLSEDETEETYLIGDLNSDDAVNVVDIVSMVNFIFGGNTSEEIMELADVNNDGVVNVVDIVVLVNMILNVED